MRPHHRLAQRVHPCCSRPCVAHATDCTPVRWAQLVKAMQMLAIHANVTRSAPATHLYTRSICTRAYTYVFAQVDAQIRECGGTIWLPGRLGAARVFQCRQGQQRATLSPAPQVTLYAAKCRSVHAASGASSGHLGVRARVTTNGLYSYGYIVMTYINTAI